MFFLYRFLWYLTGSRVNKLRVAKQIKKLWVESKIPKPQDIVPTNDSGFYILIYTFYCIHLYTFL